MAYLFVFGRFLLLGVVSSVTARAGYRGEVGDSSVGYEVPAKVKSDPALRKRANSLVAFWCTGPRFSVSLHWYPSGASS